MSSINFAGQIEILHQPTGHIRLGDYLKSHLKCGDWSQFRAAVAFVKYTGVRHIFDDLKEFSKFAEVKISVGIDLGGTSYEGLKSLLDCLEERGDIFIFHNENPSTFHPKLFLFCSDVKADITVGSGNLTEGGLFTNYEVSLSISLDLAQEYNRLFLSSLESILDKWAYENAGTCRKLTPELLETLLENGYLLREEEMRHQDAKEISTVNDRKRRQPEDERLFVREAVPQAPRVLTDYTRSPSAVFQKSDILPSISAQSLLGFVMTLQRTDVGAGQITPGTSRRSPEIFIPLAARDYNPDFWGWPNLFSEDSSKPGKKDRRQVPMRLGTDIIQVNMMTWPDKHDFRLRSEHLRSAGNEGDILRIERTDGSSGFEYYVEIIPQGTSQYQTYLALCTHATRNSRKRWGYY